MPSTSLPSPYKVRKSLGLTQTQMADLLGVHPITISKWERPEGGLEPTAHQWALLDSFQKAGKNDPDIGKLVVNTLAVAGVALAMFLLLKAAFKSR